VNLEAKQLDHHDISCQTLCPGNCGQCDGTGDGGGVLLCWKMAMYMFLCFSSGVRNCLSRCGAQCSLGGKETPYTLVVLPHTLHLTFPFKFLGDMGVCNAPYDDIMGIHPISDVKLIIYFPQIK
jgi:hypothetical protein